MLLIKKSGLYGINYSAHGIDYAAGQKPAEGCGCNRIPQFPKYSGATQPIEMYIIDENHFGQVTQQALSNIPIRAIPHTTVRRVYPALPPRTIRHIGVYEPAIRTKIII